MKLVKVKKLGINYTDILILGIIGIIIEKNWGKSNMKYHFSTLSGKRFKWEKFDRILKRYRNNTRVTIEF